ncbi:MAG: transposase [Desulfitobacteriaceae bacterium]
MIKEVEKFHRCGDPKNGFKLLVCEACHDQKDGQEKREKLTVEEFMARLIVHIPDEQFKTIRYYGVYSRRIKAICKKVISVWQKEMRKWIVCGNRQRGFYQGGLC